MAKEKCIKCSWEDHGVNQGLIRGLCSECTVNIHEKARDRGIYLRVRKGDNPPPSQREKTVDGLKLWWWQDQWRIEQ